MTDKNTDLNQWVIETSDETFQQDVFDRSHKLPVVVDFWAEWCQPCRLLAPMLEKLAQEGAGKFLLVKADTDKVPQAAAQFGVQSIPAVYGVRNGEIVDFFVGVLPEAQLSDWLERLQPSKVEVLTQEAELLLVADPSAAETKLRQAMQEDARVAAPRICLAQLLLDQSRLEECQEIIDQLDKRGFLEPEAERIKSALAVRQQGDAAGELDSCRESVEQDPDDMNAQLQLAKALAAAEEYKESLDVALHVVELDRQGAGEEARQVMVDVFRLLPDDSELTTTYRRKLSAALY